MSFSKKAATKAAAATIAPRIPQLAPGLTASFVHEALDKAITGIGPLPPAAEAAEKQRAEQKGDVDRGIHEVIENHVRYAAVQGFATNIGGLTAMAVMVPANITGLALLQCRMVAGIVHLRGYDLADKRVRNAILTSLLGEERILSMIKSGELPGTPMELAALTVADPAMDQRVSSQVASELIARIAGKRIATTVARRTPIVGGVVGAGTDAFVTWKIGRYADREFLPKSRR